MMDPPIMTDHKKRIAPRIKIRENKDIRIPPYEIPRRGKDDNDIPSSKTNPMLIKTQINRGFVLEL